MSATALLLRDTGIAVSGSDEAVHEPMLAYLKKQKLSWLTPYAAANIPPDAHLIVIGKNAKLVPESNPEVAAAIASGTRVTSYPEVLAELSKEKETVVVAGSYGKSTVTALLSHCLREAGLDPSFFIGAVPLNPATSARLGKGNLFVLEGDEYPSSNSDPRPKFLHYRPHHLLLTPLAHDHFNVFPTPEDYLAPFTSLIERVPKGGTIVACAEGTLSKQFIKNDKWPIITYGVRDGDYHAGDIKWGPVTSFSVSHGSATLLTATTTLLGEHNIQNIVGVATFILSRKLMSPEKLAKGIASFKGITRRLDRKSDKTSIPMFEGFGSSYEKLRSAIAAVKLHYPAHQLVVVFEPHTFSWRSRESLQWYDTAFEGAAEVYIFEPPQDGKTSTLTLKEMTERVATTGIPVFSSEKSEEIAEEFEENLREHTAVLFSSSGDLGGLIENITALAEQKFPA
jgi:UDP-N-acetylmuramate: L-alanyl-gamma-D-glutamyl-meso-diaminopimelate ligase